ncbi:MAG TPA: Rrf2 family transcriptional regulator [Planctomycetota bacterium]|nr:Rrf2 family transcriptional regulator [Planctomycetota bacterium]
MKLSTRSEYACLALLDLAERHGKGAVKTEDIARRRKIPRKYLEQILLQLQRAGYVQSRRGAHGGHSLARAPEEISLAEIIRKMDGALAPTKAVSKFFYEPGPLEQSPALLRVLRDIRDYVADRLENTSLADLVGKKRG